MSQAENCFGRLLALAGAVWLLRVIGPEFYGTAALTTNLLAAVVIQAGLFLPPFRLAVWVLVVGFFWDCTTFSALGHHVLIIGLTALLVRSQKGWWLGASAGEQAAGSVLAAVSYFGLDRFFHLLEVRHWQWPFLLSVNLVVAGGVNGFVSVVMGWWLEWKSEPSLRSAVRRRW